MRLNKNNVIEELSIKKILNIDHTKTHVEYDVLVITYIHKLDFLATCTLQGTTSEIKELYDYLIIILSESLEC